MARIAVPAVTRFEQKFTVIPWSGCWIWTGAVCKNGLAYGRFRPDPYNECLAHRFSYEVYNGPIPEGLLVLHRCDVAPCVNPDHLFLGSHADNSADMLKKNRTNPRYGGNIKLRKFTDEFVDHALQLRRAGWTIAQVSEEVGCSQGWLSQVERGLRREPIRE